MTGDRGAALRRTVGGIVLVLALAAGLAIALVGRGGAEPAPERSPGAPSSLPTMPGGEAGPAVADLRYTCGSFPFRAGLLEAGPGDDERGADPVAAALRAHLAAPDMDADFLPDTGWHLVGNDGRTAEFVAVHGEFGMAVVYLALEESGWSVSGWGDCQPRLALPAGLGDAEWAFDLTKPRPGPATQVFDALVTEVSCNSGEPADGRIVGPTIVRDTDRVLVIFATRPRPGVQTCPSNPSTRVVVDLGEPLGDRELLDGGRLPPGDPMRPRF
jgi:hypothetical protein